MTKQLLEDFIINALNEDIGDGDHSSLACIPATAQGKAKLIAKEEGILAGVEVGEAIFKYVDSEFSIKRLINDGTHIKPGDVILEISGSSQTLLKCERLVLNVMQRMSGIATRTNEYVKVLEGLNTKILDTRKTTPGMRFLEKEAVKIGGGTNHRMGLYDMIMLKDNHIDFAGGVEKAINAVHSYLETKGKKLKVEVEVRDMEELNEVIRVGKVDRVMLDNFSVEMTKEAVKLIDGKFEIESSGGITMDTFRAYAETGVDYISVGALTHHIKSLDLSLVAQ